jgi:sugar O-acyltransferase (sialic acid O-acetyltransferase NeuD family)
MVIIGAKGLAKEILTMLHWNGLSSEVWLFDNVNPDIPDLVYDRFPVIRSLQALELHFKSVSPSFVLGVGGAKNRFECAKMAMSVHGKLDSVISCHALIGAYGVKLGEGVCVLSQAIITADAEVGEGTLVNKAAMISHDAKVGGYCEISPGARILGRATVGDRTEIGTNAVILPDVIVGSGCRVGAGAVVTKDVPDGCVVAGIPAKQINRS